MLLQQRVLITRATTIATVVTRVHGDVLARFPSLASLSACVAVVERKRFIDHTNAQMNQAKMGEMPAVINRSFVLSISFAGLLF